MTKIGSKRYQMEKTLPEPLSTAAREEPGDPQGEQASNAGSESESLASETQNGKSGDEERMKTSKASKPEPTSSSFKSVPIEKVIGLGQMQLVLFHLGSAH